MSADAVFADDWFTESDREWIAHVDRLIPLDVVTWSERLITSCFVTGNHRPLAPRDRSPPGWPKGGLCPAERCLFRVVCQTSDDPIPDGRRDRRRLISAEGPVEKRTQMAVRRYTAVVLPAGGRVLFVSCATHGGLLLAGLGEQKTKLLAAQ